VAETLGGIARFTLVQTAPPPGLAGRVQATVRVCGWGALALGGTVGGGLGQGLGLRSTLALAAFGLLLTPLGLLAARVHTRRNLV